jgi:hypothetical protein
MTVREELDEDIVRYGLAGVLLISHILRAGGPDQITRRTIMVEATADEFHTGSGIRSLTIGRGFAPLQTPDRKGQDRQ